MPSSPRDCPPPEIIEQEVVKYRNVPDQITADIPFPDLPPEPTNKDLAQAYRDARVMIEVENAIRRQFRDSQSLADNDRVGSQ